MFHKVANSNFLRGDFMNGQEYLVINNLVNILRVKLSQIAIDLWSFSSWKPPGNSG